MQSDGDKMQQQTIKQEQEKKYKKRQQRKRHPMNFPVKLPSRQQNEQNTNTPLNAHK
jgi:hypothetical protein